MWNLKMLSKQDKVLNGAPEAKVLKIAWSGLNPMINPIIKTFAKTLLCFTTIMHHKMVHFYGRTTTYCLIKT